MLPRLVALGALLTLLASAPASAWHWEDEVENEQYGSRAGDPRILEEDAGCIGAVANVSEVDCLVLYAHVLHPRDRIPLNVHRPPECARDLATGPPSADPDPFGERRTGHLAPHFIDYDFWCREHNFPLHFGTGHGADLRISSAFPMTAYWSLSADLLERGSSLPPHPATDLLPSAGAMPCVTVRIVLETGRFAGDGTVITEGSATKTVLSTPHGSDPLEVPAEAACPGAEGRMRAEDATEFRVELAPVDAVIPADENFLLRIEWYQWDGGDPNEPYNVMQGGWNMRTGSAHLPRVVVAVEDAFEILSVTPSVFDERFQVRFTLRSPLGAYDMDLRNLRMRILDEAGQGVPLRGEVHPTMTMRSCADCFFDPQNVSFRFDPADHGVPPGTYTLRIEGTNWQHTADVEWNARLVVQEDGAELHHEAGSLHLQSAPAVEAPATPFFPFTLLAALLALRRRCGSSGLPLS